MKKRKTNIDVLICGYYGFGNLGDELLLSSIVALLVQNGINDIAVLSASPEDTAQKLNVKAYYRWCLKEIFKALKTSRTLLLGGGGLFQDTTSVASCFYYWFIVAAARFLGVKVWTVGQSVGPLNTVFGRVLTKHAFSSCVYCSVRDEKSFNTLAEWGIKPRLSFDCAMSLDVKRNNVHGNKLLLNLRPGYDNVARDVLCSAICCAKENHLEIFPVAFAEEDAAFMQKFLFPIDVALHQTTVVKTLSDFENITYGAFAAFGMRLHFVVLSYLAGIPVAAGAYDPKVKALCLEFAIPETKDGGSVSAVSGCSDVQKIKENILSEFAFGLKAVMEEKCANGS